MGAAEPAAPLAPGRHPLVERVLAPGAPEGLRLGAARGALPIPLHDLLHVQLALLRDPSATVVAAARDSLGRVAEDAVLPVLRDPGCDPRLLDHFARSGRFHGEALASIIAHPAITDATLEALAGGADPETLSLLVTNEVRVIGNATLRSALRGNANLPAEGRRRMAELERDFVGKDPIRLNKAAGPAIPAEPPPAPAPVAPSEVWTPPAADGEDAMAGEEASPAADPNQELLAEEALRQSDAFQRIMKLNVAERQLLAMKGSSEERTILIRDTARIVSQSVLKNPRLSETEITGYAAMRNVNEDILRAIASNREWTKAYAVVVALIRNPKTPPGLSIQFLARLGTRDLKIAAADKNIPELVRRNARNLFMARTQPAKKGSKKAH